MKRTLLILLTAGLGIFAFKLVQAEPLVGGNIKIAPDTISNGGGRLTGTTADNKLIVIEDSIGGFGAGGSMSNGTTTLDSGFAGSLFVDDGIDDAWLATHSITASFLAANPLDDADRDGVPLILEAAFNLNPALNDASGLPTVKTTTVGNARHLTIETRRHRRMNFTFKILGSPTMLPGSWTDATATFTPSSPVHLDSDTDTVSYQSAAPVPASGKSFYRLEVSKP
jgi:hypothetical protein